MFTQKQFAMITQLNMLMNNNEYFCTTISTDPTVRNNRNIYECLKMSNLYSYLINHSEMLDTIFETNTDGSLNMYNAHKVINTLLSIMCKNNTTPAQAIKELKKNK